MASLIEKIEQLKRIDQLIRLKATGTPKMLAQKLRCSERHIYNIISDMKAMGAVIYYDQLLQSYCYETDISFSFGFRVK